MNKPRLLDQLHRVVVLILSPWREPSTAASKAGPQGRSQEDELARPAQDVP